MGLLFLILVALPLVGLAFRRRSPVLIGQVAAVGVSVMLGALLAMSALHLLPGAGILLTAVAVAAFAASGPALVAHACRCAIARLRFGCRRAGAHLCRPYGDLDRRCGAHRWSRSLPDSGPLAVAVVLVAGVISVSSELAGARLATATLVVTVTWMGLESVVYPDRVGSLGTAWGWVAVGWAISFLVLALRHREHQPIR